MTNNCHNPLCLLQRNHPRDGWWFCLSCGWSFRCGFIAGAVAFGVLAGLAWGVAALLRAVGW